MKKSELDRFLRKLVSKFSAVLGVLFFPLAFFLKLLGVRVLEVNYQAIGHLAIEPDIYLRDQKIYKKKNFTILFPPQSLRKRSLAVTNRFLLKLWEDHYFVVTNFFAYLLLSPILKSRILKQETKYYQSTKAEAFYTKNKEAARIYDKYREVCGTECNSLLKLKQEDIERGKYLLEQLGIPRDASYVCFSCREPGHYSIEDARRTSCRNASPENLKFALDKLMKKGKYCIRLGSPFSAPLSSCFKDNPKIVDYPHTKAVNELMDVFLLTSCDFFIGNNSGLTWAAGVLGTPCVITNIVPFGVRSFFAQDIGIYKLQKSKISGKLLPFSHCLHSLLTQSINIDDYEEFQVELVENTPEEIRDVVIEMMDRLEGKLAYSPEEEQLQTKFLSMLTPYNLNYRSSARVGRAFLKKYEFLLPQFSSRSR